MAYGVTARGYGVVEVGGTGAGYGAAGALSAQRRAWLCTEPDDARIMLFLLTQHVASPLGCAFFSSEQRTQRLDRPTSCMGRWY